MSIFDLLFLLFALVTLASLIVAGTLAVGGRRKASFRVLRGLGIALLGYLAVDLTVSFLEPQRVLSVGEPWCFDDWCLTVEAVTVTPSSASAGVSYDVALRVSSRARRVSQRARGAWIYLIDEDGQRFAPEPGVDAIPLDALLGPGESLTTSRSFRVPAGARPVGLITGHGGPYCSAMSLLVIGAGGCLFHRPPMVGMP